MVLLCDNEVISQNKRRINRNTCFKGHENKSSLYGTTEGPFHMDWSFTVGLASISEDMASSTVLKVLTKALPYIRLSSYLLAIVFIPALTACLLYLNFSPDISCIGGVLPFR